MADVPVLAPAEELTPWGKSRKLIVLTVVAALVLMGGGVGAWFVFGPHGAKRPAAPKHEPLAPPQYVALDPPFVVNFENDQQVRFLQVTAQLMSRDLPTVELLKANDPVVRNDLLLLFGGQKYSVISTREGKEQLRTQTLEAVRRVVAQAGGRPERVEAVYFTSFVMQ
ncbi:MAG: flagellar biosynthesis protein FliL [Gammaproteobacteria bacterium]|nr:flagellar biosynthesis protein FliL [Gammaproteobacteria bacterium]